MSINSIRWIAPFSRFLGLLLVCLGLLFWWDTTTPARAAAEASFRVYLPVVVNGGALNTVTTTVEQQVVDLTNQLRQQHGCAPLNVSPALSAAAHAHSQEMADHNYFSHTDLAGQDSAWRAQQAGYTGSAGWENIAAGQPTAAEVVATWYNETPPDDGHRRNILNCALTEIGVGYAANPAGTYGVYWTQDFGMR